MALTFDGATQYLLNSSGAPLSAQPLTMACWAKATTITGGPFVMMSLQDADAAASADGFQLYVSASGSGGIVAQSKANAVTAAAVSSVGATVGPWFHAAAVFTSTTSRAAFLNGGSKGTNTTSNSPAAVTRASVAAEYNNATAAFLWPGTIAEAAIWNVALTDAEIAVLATAASPLMVRPSALVAYWPMIGNNDPVRDLRNGLGLTPAAAPTKADHCRIRYPKPPSFDRSYLP